MALSVTGHLAMRLGGAPACEDVPCTTCEMYLGMRERVAGTWPTGAPALADCFGSARAPESSI
jgi:hypothetical protein